jgi:L-rhamnose isomerase
MIRALLAALIEPTPGLREREVLGDFTGRLALVDELKALPLGAVWDYYCAQQGVPVAPGWMDEVKDYEARVTTRRLD